MGGTLAWAWALTLLLLLLLLLLEMLGLRLQRSLRWGWRRGVQGAASCAAGLVRCCCCCH